MPYTFDSTAVFEELVNHFRVTGSSIEVDFRELAPWIRKGDQFTHQIHPYPAKLIPQIASFFVGCSNLAQEGDAVLDPFCGTGTVALEASLAGRVPWGADANPLALLIARVKTHPYVVATLREHTVKVLTAARDAKVPEGIAVLNTHLWYAPQIHKRLEQIKTAISEVSNQRYRDFFLLCLSSLARRVSYADPRISVPVRLKDKPQYSKGLSTWVSERMAWLDGVNVFEEFKSCCEQNIDRIEQTNRTMPKRRQMATAGIAGVTSSPFEGYSLTVN